MADIIGANSCDGLGGTGEANGLAILIVIGRELGISVGANIGRACILCETFDLHS